jgi:MATE family multidrug resistance protein
VRVGQSLGARELRRARQIGWMGVAICGLFMAMSALIMVVLREPVTRLYTQDPAVREIAVGLLFMAMIFQISDGLQVGAAGALRGYKDAKVPLLLNIFAFWVVGLPVAYGAGLVLGYGPKGVWLGLAAGLTVAALLLGLRFARVSNAVCAHTAAVPVPREERAGAGAVDPDRA